MCRAAPSGAGGGRSLSAGQALSRTQGYEVKGEVRGCDLVARRGDEPPVIVELKLRFNLALVLQGIDRLALSERVYLAVPRPRRAGAARAGLVPGGAGDPPVVPPARARPDSGRPAAQVDGRRGAGALSPAAGAAARGAADRRIRAPRRRHEYRRPSRASDRHRLSPGRAALRPRARRQRRRCGSPNCATATGVAERRADRCSAMSMAGSRGSAAASTRCPTAGATALRHFAEALAALADAGADPPRAASHDRPAPRDEQSAPADRRLFRRRFAAAAAARRRAAFGAPVFVVDFDRGVAALPHLGLVRPFLRAPTRRTAGHRAVEHGPALPGAPRVSLRAADVARLALCERPVIGAAARGRRRRDVALYARLRAGMRADPGRRRRERRRRSHGAGST